MDVSRRAALLGITAITATGVTAYALGFGRDMPGTAQYFSQDGVALRGTDPVAYFTDGGPVAGSTEHTTDWAGTTWQFATADNLAAFKADPEAYAPQFGGYCAWAVAEKGQLFSTQPANWSIVDGKLYLNYDEGVQATWNTDRDGFIERGHARWPEVQQLLS